MNNWTIKSFVTARGIDVIQEWIESLPIKAQVAVDQRITFLALKGYWYRPYAHKLKGYDGIWEIIIQQENVQYRPLGCFGPGEKVFSLLIGAKEKNNKFEPKGAPKIAEKRKKMIFQKEGYLNEYF